MYHVPGEVGQPVDGRIHAAHKLQVFGFTDALLDEEEDEAGGDEGHGEDHTNRHHHIRRGRGPVRKENMMCR